VASECVFECNPGFLECDGGCCRATAIAAGGDTSCAIVGGAVRCWGRQLGFPALTRSSIPVQISGISGATKIAVGGAHACAIAGGQVLCWGANGAGQLGVAGADSPTPLVVSGVTNPDRITAGDRHSCAVNISGTVTCWGANDLGQSTVPAVTASLIGAGTGYTCAAVSGGAVRCWGQASATSPIASGTTALAAGAGHTCAISQNDAFCWGAGAAGQLGDGRSADSATPVKVSGISGASTIVGAGGAHSCAVGSNGTNLYCWGSNSSGQLGIGNQTNQSQAASVGLAGVVELALGSSHSCARLSDGSVECWGANDQGQAGTGTADPMIVAPTFVTGK
jgi:alpha-tubulin suppressor-like RCC1 family protein